MFWPGIGRILSWFYLRIVYRGLEEVLIDIVATTIDLENSDSGELGGGNLFISLLKIKPIGEKVQKLLKCDILQLCRFYSKNMSLGWRALHMIP